MTERERRSPQPGRSVRRDADLCGDRGARDAGGRIGRHDGNRTKRMADKTRIGWHLATGGADGADTALTGGAPAGQRTIWLPWRGYNGHLRGPDSRLSL